MSPPGAQDEPKVPPRPLPDLQNEVSGLPNEPPGFKNEPPRPQKLTKIRVSNALRGDQHPDYPARNPMDISQWEFSWGFGFSPSFDVSSCIRHTDAESAEQTKVWGNAKPKGRRHEAEASEISSGPAFYFPNTFLKCLLNLILNASQRSLSCLKANPCCKSSRPKDVQPV